MAKVFVMCAILLFHNCDESWSMIYPSVQWIPTNPIFKDSTTLNVVSLSKILLVCPNPATVPILQHDNIPKESLYENIWMVDKQGYETCTANTSRSGTRLLKTCDKPLDLKYLEIVFQFYSATPSGLEFVPGKEYYFISTADGSRSSLTKTSGGHCSSHNMKLKFYVCSFKDSRCLHKKPSKPRKTPTSTAAAKLCPSPSLIYIPTCISKTNSMNSVSDFANITLPAEVTSGLISTSHSHRTSSDIISTSHPQRSLISSSPSTNNLQISTTTIADSPPPSALSSKLVKTGPIRTIHSESLLKMYSKNDSSMFRFNVSPSLSSTNTETSKQSRLLKLLFSSSSQISPTVTETITKNVSLSRLASNDVNDKINVTKSSFNSSGNPVSPLAQKIIFPSMPINTIDKVISQTTTQSLSSLRIKTTSTVAAPKSNSSSQAHTTSSRVFQNKSFEAISSSLFSPHVASSLSKSQTAISGESSPPTFRGNSMSSSNPFMKNFSSISPSVGVSRSQNSIPNFGSSVYSSVSFNGKSEVKHNNKPTQSTMYSISNSFETLMSHSSPRNSYTSWDPFMSNFMSVQSPTIETVISSPSSTKVKGGILNSFSFSIPSKPTIGSSSTFGQSAVTSIPIQISSSIDALPNSKFQSSRQITNTHTKYVTNTQLLRTLHSKAVSEKFTVTGVLTPSSISNTNNLLNNTDVSSRQLNSTVEESTTNSKIQKTLHSISMSEQSTVGNTINPSSSADNFFLHIFISSEQSTKTVESSVNFKTVIAVKESANNSTFQKTLSSPFTSSVMSNSSATLETLIQPSRNTTILQLSSVGQSTSKMTAKTSTSFSSPSNEFVNVTSTTSSASPSYTESLSKTQWDGSSLPNTLHPLTSEPFSLKASAISSSSIYDKFSFSTSSTPNFFSTPSFTAGSNTNTVLLTPTLLTPAWNSTVSLTTNNNASVSTALPKGPPVAGKIIGPKCSATTEELVNNTRLVAQFLSSTDLQIKKMLVVMQSMSNLVKSLQDKLENCSQSMTTQSSPPLLTNPPGNIDCALRMDGHYSYPGHPNKYIVCDNGRTHVMTCPDPKMKWNQEIKQCDWTVPNPNGNQTPSLP